MRREVAPDLEWGERRLCWMRRKYRLPSFRVPGACAQDGRGCCGRDMDDTPLAGSQIPMGKFGASGWTEGCIVCVDDGPGYGDYRDEHTRGEVLRNREPELDSP